jgi:hypothetical protein
VTWFFGDGCKHPLEKVVPVTCPLGDSVHLHVLAIRNVPFVDSCILTLQRHSGLEVGRASMAWEVIVH